LTFALALAAAALAPGPASAQSGTGNAVREFIDRNAELLDQAAALVQETNSIKARGLLETAASLHKQSVALLDQNATAMAGRTAVRAREVIQQTIAVARREARVEEQATRMIERAVTRLEQARGAFEETGRDDLNARRLIVESGDNLRRAREQMQEHMFETSLRLAESSLALSTRAIRMLRGDGRGPDVAEEIDRTQRILDRVTETPAADPSLARLVEQAVDMQRRAFRSAEQGETAIAVEQTRGARTLALRALRAGGPAAASSEEDALRAVQLTDDILEGARGVAAEAADDALARRIAEAARQQDAAHRALDADDYPQAIRLTSAARDAVRAALRAVDVTVDPAAVETALSRTDAVIEELRGAVGGHAGARAFLERASTRQRDARQALADGDARRALALTRVAHNLAQNGRAALDDAR
jgi:hypothetical protein